MLAVTRQRSFFDDEVRIALRCLSALFAVCTFGTLGFMIVEGWDAWKSLFFTLITVTTVGYGDGGLSPSGEKFAAVLLLLGIGTATYSITSLAQFVFNTQAIRIRKMQRSIDQLNDHFIICGYGRIGQIVARELEESGATLVVIEQESAIVDFAVQQERLALLGNSTDDDVLVQAGIKRARGVICATQSDAENVFVTLTARELNPTAFIASRASSEQAARRMERAGATVVVSPYTTAGLTIADAILRPNLGEFLKRYRGNLVEISEMTIPSDSPVVGRQLMDVGRQFPTVVFVALQRDGQPLVIRPAGSDTFAAGDILTIASDRASLDEILDFADVSSGVLPEDDFAAV